MFTILSEIAFSTTFISWIFQENCLFKRYMALKIIILYIPRTIFELQAKNWKQCKHFAIFWPPKVKVNSLVGANIDYTNLRPNEDIKTIHSLLGINSPRNFNLTGLICFSNNTNTIEFHNLLYISYTVSLWKGTNGIDYRSFSNALEWSLSERVL